ncbi:MAG: hypothetical protein ABF739_07285, partial [Acetobacter okinawensis]|uniref:hypothetical protein n=1 Tax=Acetobacter okinawensis TaxID=1076594 RepID=UPI0039E8F479
ERAAHNGLVAGSSPARRTTFSMTFYGSCSEGMAPYLTRYVSNLKQVRFFATNICDHGCVNSGNFWAVPVHQTKLVMYQGVLLTLYAMFWLTEHIQKETQHAREQ